MKRFAALWKDTWWLWLLMVGGGCAAGLFLHFIFFVSFPICFFAFIYFGLMRYDQDGNPTGDMM
ncbi:MAG: hypothetical protein AAGA30_03050 [Planctomycetota bacterium]